MYKVHLFKEKNGRSPIKEFMDASSESLRSKIIKQLRYLEIYGFTSENHNLKKLTGTPLWEVRILGRDSTRLVCVTVIKKEIVVVHIFKKKSNKTSSKDLNISMKRYKEELDR